MKNLDDVYELENLVTVDPYQFNAVLLALARQKLPSFVNKDSIQTDTPFLSLETNGKVMMIQPPYNDRRCVAPKVDCDLWDEFERIDPEGAKPKLRP
jgi:hypothetical protein